MKQWSVIRGQLSVTTLIACCLLGFAAMAVAADSKGSGPKIAYTSNAVVKVPIRMSDADRAKIKSVKFYVKGPNGTWKLQETGSAKTEQFTFQAPADGEYWFAFPTDDDGRADSTEHLMPVLIVVIDTKAPEMVVQPLVVASGQTYVQCMMRDANPDPATLTCDYELPDGTWKPLLALGADTPGVYRSADGSLPNKIRVKGKDKAGNEATQMVALSAPPSAITPSRATSAPIGVTPVPASPVPGPAAPVAIDPMPALPVPVTPIEKTTPALSVPEPRVTEKPNVSTPPVTPPASVPPITRQVVNSYRCSLAYALDNLGTQAVQRIEAYCTRDEGKTWRKIAEDMGRGSKIELSFSEDGLYGVVLVVSTALQVGTPPVAGDQPDWWIDVDTSAPEVKLESTTLGTGDDMGLLMLNWTVRDRNLAPDAVEISWTTQPDGPWHVIAKGLRSDCQYRWAVPREATPKAYLKIESTDRAGNVGRFVTPQAVATELPKPKARVIGINPTAAR
ncbi:MAG: hypothetical protein ACJ8C4_00670 [Gemmataceae bacterium]